MAGNLGAKLVGIISTQLNGIKQQFAKVKQVFAKVVQVVNKFVKKTFDLLMRKPSDKSDYVRIGKFYLSKRLLTIICLGIIVVIFIFVQFFFPWADGRLWTANIKLNSQKYHTFTGKVRVKDDMGVMIYEGQMKDGQIEGEGKQYDSKGELVYVGSFEKSQYSGKGELYSNSVMIYSGTFAKNLYEGQGELFDETGKLIYSGNFALGQRSGKGVSYNPKTGLRKYYGDFANDLPEGRGVLYEEDGSSILYDGDFIAGQYSGTGRLYEKGVLKYQGEFAEGLFEGNGTLYDTATKKILYQGAFVKGLYEGEGTLYDPNTSKVIYSGQFTAGQRQGTGSSYDRLGSVSFNGEFKDDNINYLNYLGAPLDDVTAQFGKESYRTTVSDRLILTYLSLDTSIVFIPDAEKDTYLCEKIIMGTRDTFMGLKSNSSKDEIEQVMGQPFSSVNFNFSSYYDTIFSQLSINLSSKKGAPSDKFVLDNYFIRFYYNANRTEIQSIEVGSM